MAFHVPESNESLFDDVEKRFRLLLKNRVITGIEEVALDRWLANFQDEVERYFAACVLSRLTFRSQSMIESSIDQVLQCMLLTSLRKQNIFSAQAQPADIESFLEALQTPPDDYPIRFVGVDGSKQTDTGKSGVLMIRSYKQHAKINKKITCRPDLMDQLSEHVRCIVFVDDMLGTGEQFGKFAKLHDLAEKSKKWRLIYCPLVAFHKGVDRLKRDCPWLTVLPIEVLNDRHKFFSPSAHDPALWAIDQENTVADAKSFFDDLAVRRGIPKSTQHGLELVLGFERATPNNTISVLWASSDNWAQLLKR
ncbi:hypothetical protein ACVW0Y_003773 [Pseudomonas sp. TE3786]